MTAIVWFRRDLRLHDHPALCVALAEHGSVVPVFCLDDRLLHGRHSSGPRTQFLLESLADLDARLRERGSALVIRRGRPEDELPRLAHATNASAVYASAEVTPFGRARDAALPLELRTQPGVTVVDEVGALRTNAGAPYGVFSPFERTWNAEPRRRVLDAPRAMPLPANLDAGAGGRVPALAELGLKQEVEDPLPGGETAARRRLAGFLRGPVERYAEARDVLADDGTSRLSPYLHLGCVSPREVEARLPPAGSGAQAFRRQLCWRDFHHHVLLAHPSNAREEHQPRYRGTLEWDGEDELFDAWREGRTGFPLVDAGMRQLLREGWMHNRARLVTASFLTKELGIDWRRGERHFMRLLIDGDEANNNGNWQWVTSVGVDPQPYFRRIYNPALHMERFDPDGRYVRRYVPELGSRDYPAPIVERRDARRRAIERYRAATAGAAVRTGSASELSSGTSAEIRRL